MNGKNIHLAFEISIIAKGLYAFLEVCIGALLLFVPQGVILRTVRMVTEGELSEDPSDFLSQFLLQSANALTLDTQHFVAVYLLIHGFLKGFLVLNLLRERLWAFPLAIVIFGFFIFYQMFRFWLTHSIFLLILSIFDSLVIWFAWREYEVRKKNIGVL